MGTQDDSRAVLSHFLPLGGTACRFLIASNSESMLVGMNVRMRVNFARSVDVAMNVDKVSPL